MTRTFFQAIAGVLMCVAACSCRALYPATHRAGAERLPDAYAAADAREGGAVSNLWWRSFGSRELDRLVDCALEGSLSLLQAAARLRQARALERVAGSARVPDVAGTAGVGWSDRQSIAEDGAKTGRTVETYSLGAAASYEVDLWGRVAAAHRSARLGADALFFDLQTAMITLAGRVTDVWLNTIEATEQVRLLDQQARTNREILDLMKSRLVKSRTPLLDVYQQEQNLRAVEALLPPARRRVELLRHELAVLLGRPVGEAPGVVATKLPALPPRPATGVPADLLENRPDVRSGWFRLEAAGYDVAAARAGRLPSVRLTASHEYSADAPGEVLDSWASALAGALSAPLFDGGRRRSELARERAVLEDRLAGYRQTVLAAMREVEDALVTERRSREWLEALERQFISADRVLQEAARGYRKGAVDYLTVLTSTRNKQQLERDLLSARRQLLSNRVLLYRALGGSWDGETRRLAERNAMREMERRHVLPLPTDERPEPYRNKDAE